MVIVVFSTSRALPPSIIVCLLSHDSSKVVDVHASLKTRFVTSRPSAPWYSEEIAEEKRKRCKLERRLRKSGTEADKLQYVYQCSRVRKLLKSSKMSQLLRFAYK